MKLLIEKVENGFILVLPGDAKAIYKREADLFKRLKTELNKPIEDLESDEIEIEELEEEL